MRSTKIRRLIGTGAGCLVLGLSAVAIGSPVGAAEGSDARRRPTLTREQKQCLEEQGITRPIRPLTHEKRAALKAAAQACGIERPARTHRPGRNLTDEQKQCLEEQGITRPIRPLTHEKRAALKAAAQACGIERPAHG